MRRFFYAAFLGFLLALLAVSPVGAQTVTGNVTTLPAVVFTGGMRITALRTESATTSLSSTDSILLMDSAGATTVNLPACTAGINGTVFSVKNINTGTATLDGNAAETIDGAVTYALSAQWQSINIVCVGSTTSWVTF